MGQAKPNISCPHCREILEATSLPKSRQYRTEYGIDVFQCHHCGGDFKIEPSEYMFVRSQMEKGELPSDGEIAIDGIPATELAPSEQRAKFDMASRGGCLGTIAVGFLLFAGAGTFSVWGLLELI